MTYRLNLWNSSTYIQSRITEAMPCISHFISGSAIVIIHVHAAINRQSTERVFHIRWIRLNKDIHHFILCIHRRIPALVNGRHISSHSTCRLTIHLRTQKLLCKARSTRHIELSIHTSHRPDERELSDIGHVLNIIIR